MRRALLGAVVPGAVVALGLGPLLAYRSDLPGRVAVHYGVSGRADGSMATDQFLVVMAAAMTVGLGACVAIALTRRKLPPMSAPSVSFVGAFIGALCAGIVATTAIGQRGLERWEDATLDPWVVIIWIAGSLITGSVAAWIAASLPHRGGTGSDAAAPTMDLEAGERVLWSSTLSARWPLLVGLATLPVVVVLTRLAELWIVALALLTAVVVATFSHIRVTADQSGLQVRYGLLRWPRTSVPIHRIATARAIDIRPADWGGWGYRGSLTLMKRAAVVLRAGPGIRLDLHDGKVFAVTINDPQDAVRLLNAEVSRLPAAQTPLV